MVVPNHVDIKIYKQIKRVKHRAVTIAFLGRLVPRKGCAQLLSALNLLKKQGRLPVDTRILIGGDGPLRQKLQNYVNAHELHRYVTFRGFIAEEKKPEFFSEADIAVFPSSGGESFGIVLLEAMAARVALLAAHNEGYEFVMGKASQQLFDPHSSAELAEKLLALIESSALRKKYVASQNKRVGHFDVDVVAQRIERVYKESIARLA